MPAGRPPIWSDADAFERAVDQYFEECKAAGEPPLWTGLALHLGFASRDALDDYAKKPDFSHSVKKALTRIEAKYEKGAATAKNPAGHIFALKNFGWRDRQDLNQNLTGGISISWEEPKLQAGPREGSDGNLQGN